jgi:hypothetical protein
VQNAANPSLVYLAPFSLQDVLQVTVLPFMQEMQAPTHWSICFGSNASNFLAMQARCWSSYSGCFEQLLRNTAASRPKLSVRIAIAPHRLRGNSNQQSAKILSLQEDRRGCDRLFDKASLVDRDVQAAQAWQTGRAA